MDCSSGIFHTHGSVYAYTMSKQKENAYIYIQRERERETAHTQAYTSLSLVHMKICIHTHSVLNIYHMPTTKSPRAGYICHAMQDGGWPL